MTAGTAIVTGASSGIGKATALRLARDGYDVAITYGRNVDGARRTVEAVEKIGRRCVARPMDLSRPDQALPALAALQDRLGPAEVLVNNAGTLALTPFLELGLAEWRAVLDTNLTGTFVVAQAVARGMVGEGIRGRIVNVSSVHEAVPLMQAAAYCASKAGIGMLTRCMALDLAPHGIRVNAVGPGEIATPMSGASEDEDVGERPRPDLPLGRPGHPDEVAETIAHLVDPAASYTTGVTFHVDGGLLLMPAVANQRRIMAALRDGRTAMREASHGDA